jgi:hypothetical protein
MGYQARCLCRSISSRATAAKVVVSAVSTRREALQTALALVLGLQAGAPVAHAKSFEDGMRTCVPGV